MINQEISIRNFAHLGDAAYELYIREKTVTATQNAKKLHKLTVSLVNAEFQAELLNTLEVHLTDDEKEIVRRARNLSVTTARRVNQKLHRISTAFEALIGYLYLTNKERLKEIYLILDKKVDEIILENLSSPKFQI